MDPDQIAVFVACAVGDVQDLAAFHGGQGSRCHPRPVLLADKFQRVARQAALILLPRKAGQLRRAVGKEDGDEPPALHPIAGDAPRDGVDQMVQLPPGLFQGGNIVKDALKQGKTAVFPDLPRLDMDPDHMPVPVLFAKLKLRGGLVPDRLMEFLHHHRAVLGIDQLCGVPLDKFAVFLHGIAGELRHTL